MNIDTSYMELRFSSAAAAFRRLERLRAVLGYTILATDEDVESLDEQQGPGAVLARYIVCLATYARSVPTPVMPQVRFPLDFEVIQESPNATITVVPTERSEWRLTLERSSGAPTLDPTNSGRDAMLAALMSIPDGEGDLPPLWFCQPIPGFVQAAAWLEWATRVLAAV